MFHHGSRSLDATAQGLARLHESKCAPWRGQTSETNIDKGPTSDKEKNPGHHEKLEETVAVLAVHKKRAAVSALAVLCTSCNDRGLGGAYRSAGRHAPAPFGMMGLERIHVALKEC